MAIDRWIHYDQRSVAYGYIVFLALADWIRVASAIVLVWGTYIVVWKDLEGRFRKNQRGYWWFAAKIAIFLVFLVSFFYVVLYLCLSVVWMEFRSLNSIADIATKRTHFEIATAALLTGFCFLMVIAATATNLFRRKVTGGVNTVILT
jgi:hypothetical protein